MYNDLQEKWVSFNKIENGDLVKVVRSASTGERGWNNSWTERMDAFIGEIMVVLDNSDLANEGIALYDRKHPNTHFRFPFFVLEPLSTVPKRLLSEGSAEGAWRQRPVVPGYYVEAYVNKEGCIEGTSCPYFSANRIRNHTVSKRLWYYGPLPQGAFKIRS